MTNGTLTGVLYDPAKYGAQFRSFLHEGSHFGGLNCFTFYKQLEPVSSFGQFL